MCDGVWWSQLLRVALFGVAIALGPVSASGQEAKAAENADPPEAKAEAKEAKKGKESSDLFGRGEGAAPTRTITEIAKTVDRVKVRELENQSRTLRTISVGVTPPISLARFMAHQPAEQIVAQKVGSSYRLFVRVNYIRPDMNRYTETQSAITKEDWQALLKVIVEQELWEWKPEGSANSRIGSRPITSYSLEGDTKRQRSWTRLVENGAAPAALESTMVRLARRYSSRLPLQFLTVSADATENEPELSVEPTPAEQPAP